MTESVRLVVDAGLCDGHGICALRCPELITLDEWGFAGAERGAVPDQRVLRRARRAVAACPCQALTLVAVGPEPADKPTLHLVTSAHPSDTGTPGHPHALGTAHNRRHGGG